MARRTKANPAREREQAFEAVGLAPDSSHLANNREVEVTRKNEARQGKIVEGDSARRLDAFEALKPSMKGEEYVGCYDAARRLERDYLIRYGMHDHGRPERVDCEPQKFDRGDKMIMAGQRIDAVMERLSLRDGWLLRDLIMPTKPGEDWRRTVARITGEENPNAQGAAVRAACSNLRDAYGKADVASRKAA